MSGVRTRSLALAVICMSCHAEARACNHPGIPQTEAVERSAERTIADAARHRNKTEVALGKQSVSCELDQETRRVSSFDPYSDGQCASESNQAGGKTFTKSVESKNMFIPVEKVAL